MNWMCVFVGGGLGSVLRYAAGFCVDTPTCHWTTFVVNVVGSFVLGLLCGWCDRFGWPESVRLALTVGLCGGFTTFSTFTKEAFAFAQTGRWGVFAAYVLGSIVCGFAAVALGFSLAFQGGLTDSNV